MADESKIRKRKLKMIVAGAVVILAVVVTLIGLKWQKREEAAKSIDHILLARSASGNGNFAESEKEYRIALDANDSDPVLWREYGYVLQQEQKKTDAVSAYEKTIEFDKEDATTQNLLGNLYRDLIQYDKSETAYKEAIRLSPTLLPAIINLSHLYALEGKNDEAIALLSGAYDGTKQRSELGLQLVAIYNHTGKKSEAKDAIARILQVDPENEKALALNETI